MKSALSTAFALGTALVLTACADANPDKMAPPEVYSQSNQSAPIAAKVAFKPKVDILFVIDNSDSMVKHQENLKKNIDRFVEAFEANKRIDFQIGVTSVWDSRRYGSVSQNFHPLGELYPVQNGQPVVAGQIGQNFVTRVPNYNVILGNTLKIGVVPYKEGGPEFEELFTPVVAAIDGRNVGFIRPDAHLAVIMITDADDVSSIAPSKLASLLSQAKKNDASMYSTYAVLSLSKSCPKDPGNREHPNAQILAFLKQTKGHAYDLCDPQYGSKLAEAGRLIAKQADKAVKIQLEQIPEDGTLQVKVAGTNQDLKYQYDPYNFTVTIPSEEMEGQATDAQIEVTYVPIDVRRVGTPRVKAKSI